MRKIISISPFLPDVYSWVTWRISFINKRLTQKYKLKTIFRTKNSGNINKIIHLFDFNILRHIWKEKPDLIYCHTIWSVLYWVFSRVFLSRKYIFDDHNVEFDRMCSTRRYFLAFFVFFLEFIGIFLAEKIVVSSQFDRERLNKLYPFKFKCEIVTNKYTPENFLKNNLSRSVFFLNLNIDPKKHLILFFWFFDYMPNQEALNFIQKDLLPILDSRFHIIIAWNGSEKYKSSFQITYLWFYADIDSLIRNVDLVIAPIFSGAWVKIKVVQTLWLWKHILTTQEGARGIIDTNNLLLLTSKSDFLTNICNYFGIT